jgi:hypothetical protein
VVRPVHRGGGGLILQMRPWLGFRRGAGGQVRVQMNEWQCVTRKMSLSVHPRNVLQQEDDITTPVAKLSF